MRDRTGNLGHALLPVIIDLTVVSSLLAPSNRTDFFQALRLRNDYITPYYSVCVVFVNNPGDIHDPENLRRLNNLVSDKDFETMGIMLDHIQTGTMIFGISWKFLVFYKLKLF